MKLCHRPFEPEPDGESYSTHAYSICYVGYPRNKAHLEMVGGDLATSAVPRNFPREIRPGSVAGIEVMTFCFWANTLPIQCLRGSALKVCSD